MAKNLSNIDRVKSIQEIEAEVDSRFYRMLCRREIFQKLAQVYKEQPRKTDNELLNQYSYHPGNREIGLREAFWDEVRETAQYGSEDVNIAKMCGNDIMVVKVFKELLQSDNFCQYLLNKPVSYMQVMKTEVLGKAASIYQEILDKPLDEAKDGTEWSKMANIKLKVLANVERLCGVGVAQRLLIGGNLDVNSNTSFSGDSNNTRSGAVDLVSKMSIEQIRGRIEELEKGIRSRQRSDANDTSNTIEAEFTATVENKAS